VLLNKKANRVALTSMRSLMSFPLSCSGRKSGGMETDILVMQCPVLSSDYWQRWHCLAEKSAGRQCCLPFSSFVKGEMNSFLFKHPECFALPLR